MQDLYAALKRYWGYDSFRPMQERIISSLLSGNDAAVVMPTGGGKSLCYQLPALVLGKTVIVVSPLIALMQDQVAQLGDMGIPAALLNSAQRPEEQRQVMRAAAQGAFRLLYLSPERLARQDTVAWLQRVPVAFFAIDEAHCISEWGHEFRPEYRQLSSLRVHFPDKPIAAFTASATRRVRHDILQQLQLRDPHKYIASFHRANLRYVVHKCEKGTQRPLLLSAARAYDGQSIIVYAPTIASVEETVDFLADNGIRAIAYHGQMDNDTRRRNQEGWMNDEAPVLVGTIAFGLGINKPAVRAVVHLSLPKSIEQYYQEAGRAGRDGLPSDCVLLWQPKDAGLLAFFIEKLQDADEKRRAWTRYREVRDFAEGDRCRRLHICAHFGETPKWTRCDLCDICGSEPEWVRAAPVEALATKKKRKAAPPPAPSRSGAQPGAELPLPRRESGPEFRARAESPLPRRESGPESPARPRAALQPRPESQPRAESPIPKPAPRPMDDAGDIDPDLLTFFKEWRARRAQRSSVPAYIVLSDAALVDLCRKQPANLRELLTVSGIGERKAELYGGEIFAAFEAYRKGARVAAKAPAQVSPAEETVRLLGEGKSFEEIAHIRGRQLSTVVHLVADLVEKGRVPYRIEWVGEAAHRRVEEAIGRFGSQWLKPLREALPPEITSEQIRLVVAWARSAPSN